MMRGDPIDIFAAPPSRFTTGLADLLARRVEIEIADKEEKDVTND